MGDEWRPIETAPLDQTVLVYAAPREGMPGIVTVCRWHHDAGWCVCTLREVTHWRPLPAGPGDTP